MPLVVAPRAAEAAARRRSAPPAGRRAWARWLWRWPCRHQHSSRGHRGELPVWRSRVPFARAFRACHRVCHVCLVWCHAVLMRVMSHARACDISVVRGEQVRGCGADSTRRAGQGRRGQQVRRPTSALFLHDLYTTSATLENKNTTAFDKSSCMLILNETPVVFSMFWRGRRLINQRRRSLGPFAPREPHVPLDECGRRRRQRRAGPPLHFRPGEPTGLGRRPPLLCRTAAAAAVSCTQWTRRRGGDVHGVRRRVVRGDRARV